MLWGILSWATLKWTVITGVLQWTFPSLIPGLTRPNNLKWLMVLAGIRWRWPTIVFGLLSLGTIKWCIFFAIVRSVWAWICRMADEVEEKEKRGRPQADECEDDGDSASGSAFESGVLLRVINVAGATGEIAHILQCRDFYAVLDVPRAAEGTDIKRAFRSKQLATHPDKNHGAPGALQASQRVNLAHDTLSDVDLRRKYDARLKSDERSRATSNPGPEDSQGSSTSRQNSQGEPPKAQRARSHSPTEDEEREAFVRAAYDAFLRATMPEPPKGAHYPSCVPSEYCIHGDAPDHSFRMRCSCGYDHIATKMSARDADSARICNCDLCGSLLTWAYLPARHNDVWFEKIFMMRIALRCVGNYVYDVTEWAKCNHLMVDARGYHAPTNVHYVPIKLKGEEGQYPKREKRDTNHQQPKSNGSAHPGATNGNGNHAGPHKSRKGSKKRRG